MKNLIYLALALSLLAGCATEIQLDQKYGYRAEIKPLLEFSGLIPKLFTIDNTRDTVLVGGKGTLISIPANSFNTSGGKVELELIEALTLGDIVTLGAQTVSGDKFLETGGVIFLQAYENGQEVALNEGKSLIVKVASNQLQEGMQAFSGQFNGNGLMDWGLSNQLEPDSNLVYNELISAAMFEIPYELYPYKETYYYKDSIAKAHPEKDNKILAPAYELLITTREAQFHRRVIDIIENKKHKGTNVATVEFAERMYALSRVPHTITEMDFNTNDYHYVINTFADYQHKALDIYLAHLDKPLWYSDSLVYELLEQYSPPVPVPEFSVYALERQVQKSDFVIFHSQRLTQPTVINDMGIDLSQPDALSLLMAEGISLSEAQITLGLFRKQQQLLDTLKQTNVEFTEQLQNEKNMVGRFVVQKEVQYYLLTVNDLGWINVDRIYEAPNAKEINLATEIAKPEGVDFLTVSLIFKTRKSFINAWHYGGDKYQITKEGGNKLPIGEKATLLAISFKDGQPYLGMRHITIGEKELETLTVTKISEKDYKEIMSSL